MGATGATGRHLLREVLSSPHFTRVGEFGRRVTPLDSPYVPEGAKEKLKQEVVDFEKLDVEKWKEGNWDVVFITCVLLSLYPFLYFGGGSRDGTNDM